MIWCSERYDRGEKRSRLLKSIHERMHGSRCRQGYRSVGLMEGWEHELDTVGYEGVWEDNWQKGRLYSYWGGRGVLEVIEVYG